MCTMCADFVIRVARVDETDLFGHVALADDASVDTRTHQLRTLTSIAVDDLASTKVIYASRSTWDEAWAYVNSMWPESGVSPHVSGWQYVCDMLTPCDGHSAVYACIEDWG